MKTIGIDAGDFAPGSQVNSGIKRIISGFIQEVKNHPQYIIHYYYFSSDGASISTEGNIMYIPLPRKLYASVQLPLAALKNKDNVFIAFSGYISPVMKLLNIKNIAFIYDFGFYKYPENYSAPQKLITNTTQTIERAEHIVVLTKYIEDELLERFKISKQKVTQLYAGIDHFQKNESANSNIGFPYFLYVGVVKPIKDIVRLIDCFTEYKKINKGKEKLIIIGSKEKEYYEQILQKENYKALKDSVIWLENINEKELKQYYKDAIAVLNLSKEEGFGYPVLEGLALGKKVITGDINIYTEYKKYFKNLNTTLTNNEVVREMKNKVIDITANIPNEFTWEVFTKRLLSIVRNI